MDYLLDYVCRDGRIKLFGSDSSQAMLQSDEAGSSKYLKVLCSDPLSFG